MRKLSIVLLLLSFSACTTVTLRKDGGAKLETEPTYEKTQDFFFWGLMGKRHVYIDRVCNGKDAEQLQTQQTFTNSLLGLITIGIYAPRTAKVWCE